MSEEILEEEQVVQVIKLKSGEHIIGITSYHDDESCYVHAPAIYKNDMLADFMYSSTAMGFVLKYDDAYYMEQPNEYLSVLYSEYFISINIQTEESALGA